MQKTTNMSPNTEKRGLEKKTGHGAKFSMQCNLRLFHSRTQFPTDVTSKVWV